MMKKTTVLLGLIMCTMVTWAQSAKFALGIGAEKDISTGQFSDYFSKGYGANLKLLVGLGHSGHFTFTSGVNHFTLNPAYNGGYAGNDIVVPVLAGYRYHISQFFIEPQGGLGIYNVNYNTAIGQAGTTNSTFTWGAQAGMVLNNLQFSLRYQSGTVKDDGYPTSFLALNLAYNIPIFK